MGNTAAPEKPQPAAPHGEDSIDSYFEKLFENVARILLS